VTGGPAQPPGRDRHPTVIDPPDGASALQSASPSRLPTPRRSTPSLALAPAPSQPGPTRIDRQRARRLVTAAEALRKFPYEGLGVPETNGRAALAREAIADHLQGSEACQLEAFEQALALAAERTSLAFYARDGWLDAVRAALLALLEFFEEEPEVGKYLVVHSAQAADAVLERRREVIDRIAKLLDDERAPARGFPPPLTAQAVVNGALGVLSERLSQPHPGLLIELAAPLMSFTVLPFLGVAAARRELAGPREPGELDSAGDLDVLRDSGGRVNPRASLALSVIGADPGLNNKQVASRAGVINGGHASRLLGRLERLGLIENARASDRRFGAKAWTLTSAGEKVQTAIEREAAVLAPGSAFDLPKEFVGRLEDRAVWLLRAIADQPWLRSAELAERAGVEDGAEAARLLQSLLHLGLAARERDAHYRGTPNVWRLTRAGEQLDRTIGRDAPTPPRSVALDLMWESGGRLSDAAISVLRVIGAEAQLSNNDIALRVGITDENSMSQLLARLARRELVGNTRNGGRYNSWQLTSAGEKLERAIWHETPPAAQREHALHYLRDRGARLNHRVASVLRVIGVEPQLSNAEIAERVGIGAKGHASTLLTRLARFGLIENLVHDPLPFEPNAWRLTTTGGELAAAIGDDPSSTATHSSLLTASGR
jgi:DNA-binding IclR family transcriptional regulator